jgi:hypothetical protein
MELIQDFFALWRKNQNISEIESFQHIFHKKIISYYLKQGHTSQVLG